MPRQTSRESSLPPRFSARLHACKHRAMVCRCLYPRIRGRALLAESGLGLPGGPRAPAPSLDRSRSHRPRRVVLAGKSSPRAHHPAAHGPTPAAKTPRPPILDGDSSARIRGRCMCDPRLAHRPGTCLHACPRPLRSPYRDNSGLPCDCGGHRQLHGRHPRSHRMGHHCPRHAGVRDMERTPRHDNARPGASGPWVMGSGPARRPATGGYQRGVCEMKSPGRPHLASGCGICAP